MGEQFQELINEGKKSDSQSGVQNSQNGCKIDLDMKNFGKNRPNNGQNNEDPQNDQNWGRTAPVQNGQRNDCSDSDSSDYHINQFNPLIFRGIRFCTVGNSKKHLHVTTHDDDIKMLLSRAENEIIHQFSSNGHARHAKTMQQ